ncbi:hypothetical protein Hanom_Chr12g01092091 [Helianthus anomalus]
MLCMKGVLCRFFDVVNSFGTNAWLLTCHKPLYFSIIYNSSTPNLRREGEIKSQLETLTISHRPLLRLPVAPPSYPAPPYLSSTMAPPLASSLNY